MVLLFFLHHFSYVVDSLKLTILLFLLSCLLLFHYLGPDESIEDRKERERFNEASRNHKHLTSNPRVVVGLSLLSDLLRAGDPLVLLLTHCDLSGDRKGVTIQAGGNCKKGSPEGCIQRCCSVKNVCALSPGFPSVLHLGVVDEAYCVNGSSSCSTRAKGYHPCQKTTEEEGGVTADILDDFAETCKRRNICFIPVPFCGSMTGVMENVMKRLHPDVRENTSTITTHPQNISHQITDWDPQWQNAMVLRVLRSLRDSTNAIVGKYNADNKDAGFFVTCPGKDIVQWTLEDDTLCFASEDDDTLFLALENQMQTRKERIANRVNYFRAAGMHLGKYVPSTPLHSLNMPPPIQEWVVDNTKKMMDIHGLTDPNQLTVHHILSLCGRHSVESQCKALECTPTELMEMVTKMGAESLGISVSELKEKAGENSVESRCKALKCTPTELAEMAFEKGAKSLGVSVKELKEKGGKHSVESQCKALECTSAELMEMVTKMGAESLGVSVKELKEKAGENSVESRCKALECTPTELMEIANKKGAKKLGISVSELREKAHKKSGDTRRTGSIVKTSANTYVSHHTIITLYQTTIVHLSTTYCPSLHMKQLKVGVRGSFLCKTLDTEEEAEAYRTVALKYVNDALEGGRDDISTIIEDAKRAAAKKCELGSNIDDGENIG